jgi:hypothetical protein
MSKCDVARGFRRPEDDPSAREAARNDSNVRLHREHATRVRSADCAALFSTTPLIETMCVMNSVKQSVVYKGHFRGRIATRRRNVPSFSAPVGAPSIAAAGAGACSSSMTSRSLK